MEKKNDEKIDVKIGSPEEVAWTAIRDNIKRDVENGERALEINKHLLEFAEGKVAAAIKAFRS